MSSLLQRPSTLDDLEDALLELIFAYACASPWVHGRAVYRHNPAIPAVCRRFARVYSQVGTYACGGNPRACPILSSALRHLLQCAKMASALLPPGRPLGVSLPLCAVPTLP